MARNVFAASVCTLVAVFFLPVSVSADEIVLHDGTVLICEIYKQTDEHVFYIDPEKNVCRVVSMKSVKKTRLVDEAVVDVETFLSANKSELSAKQISDLKAYLSGVAMEQEAVAERKKKMNMRGDEEGLKVLGDPKSDTRELLVEAFPEDRDGDKKKEAEAKNPEPAKKE